MPLPVNREVLTFVFETFYQIMYFFDTLSFNVNIFQMKDSIRRFVE